MTLPVVIQGGLGVAVSDWRLAAAVGRLGQLGVVSGTALDVVHARRLGDGDPDGSLRRAHSHFPFPRMSARVLDKWFSPDGRAVGTAYRTVPAHKLESPVALRELTVLANFAEVWLAKEGHQGPIGINYLEKVQLPTPHSVYGALLGGVDFVLMGAGIPADMPKLIASLARGEAVAYRQSVAGADPGDDFAVRLDPAELLGAQPPELLRPMFLAIVASNTLASFLAKDAATSPDGFVLEGATAGGHNAPPRGPLHLDDLGQPVYGTRDQVDLERLAGIGLPFWLAGGYADPERLREARCAGASGVQVGTAFALCEESAFLPEHKNAVISAALSGTIAVFTDPAASPSGYPFKVVQLPGTLSEAECYEARRRVCDLGFLRSAFKRNDGSVGYRCAGEPVDAYVRKGGMREDTTGRKCLCNALLAAVGLGQVRPTGTEPSLVTGGDDVIRVVRALAGTTGTWTAADVVSYLLDATGARPSLRDRNGATVIATPISVETTEVATEAM